MNLKSDVTKHYYLPAQPKLLNNVSGEVLEKLNGELKHYGLESPFFRGYAVGYILFSIKTRLRAVSGSRKDILEMALNYYELDMGQYGWRIHVASNNKTNAVRKIRKRYDNSEWDGIFNYSVSRLTDEQLKGRLLYLCKIHPG